MLGDPFAANASGKSAMEKSKAMFGELLKGTARSSVSAAAAPVVVASSAASAMTTTTVAASTTSATAAPTASWDVLSDQYLMGAGFKDWDKAAAE